MKALSRLAHTRASIQWHLFAAVLAILPFWTAAFQVLRTSAAVELNRMVDIRASHLQTKVIPSRCRCCFWTYANQASKPTARKDRSIEPTEVPHIRAAARAHVRRLQVSCRVSARQLLRTRAIRVASRLPHMRASTQSHFFPAVLSALAFLCVTAYQALRARAADDLKRMVDTRAAASRHLQTEACRT